MVGFYEVMKIVAILEYFSDGGFMPFLAFWHYFLDLNLFSWSNLAKKLTNFVRIKCIHKVKHLWYTYKYFLWNIWQMEV